MKIYIMRHGDAATMEEAGVTTDEARPLTEAGYNEVETMARLLGRMGVEPDLILSSPLVRARQTADIISSHFGERTGVTNSVDMAPGGSPGGVLAQILRHGRPAETVLTGHMPDVGMLAGYLAWNQPDAFIRFRTAGICRIDLPDDNPAPGYGDLRWLMPPRIGERLLERDA
jgi:phosphohistidine phosphatase